MGVAVSSWPLARAMSLCGQLGVVSGTGLDAVLCRRLQLGDHDGSLRSALGAFPLRDMAERILARYFVPGGKPPGTQFKSKPMPALDQPKALTELMVVAGFVEVFLAKHGHTGIVGINLLEKIQIPTLPILFGAILANVDFVLMGAGIPRLIPGALDRLAAHEPVELRIDVADALPGDIYSFQFNPREYSKGAESLKRPQFLGIVSSTALAQTLAKKSAGRVDGFVVEGPTAGGHNAPPRGAGELSEQGEPIYGPRDVPDISAIQDLGLPFWLAGSYGTPERFQDALGLGAQGVQVGTAFAFCNESGIAAEYKARVIQAALDGTAHVYTDPRASTTGFPFKVLEMADTLSDAVTYERRERICDLGYLRQPYRGPDGQVGYRCPGEPEADFAAKGGTFEATIGRKCLCNGLLTTVGLGQSRKSGYEEPALLTAGDDLVNLARYVKAGQRSYAAADVIAYLLQTPRELRRATASVDLAEPDVRHR